MSMDVMTLVWKYAPYEGNTLLTLLALADWSGDDGQSWPSVITLAKKSRQSERNCRYALRKIESDGFLSTRARKDDSSVYLINLKKLKSCGAKIAPVDSEGGQSDAQGGQNTAEKVSQIAPNTSHIHQLNHTSVGTPSLFESESSNLKQSSGSKDRKSPKEKTSDSRHAIVQAEIMSAYALAAGNQGLTPAWSGREAGILSRLLKSHLDWSAEALCHCVQNRFLSEENYSEQPYAWMGKLDKYLAGPLDKFGKPLGAQNGQSKDQQRNSNNQAVIDRVLQGSGGGNALPDGRTLQNRTHGNFDKVLDGVPYRLKS